MQTIAGVFIKNNGVNTCELGPRQVATNSDAGIMAELKIRRKKFFEVNYGHHQVLHGTKAQNLFSILIPR